MSSYGTRSLWAAAAAAAAAALLAVVIRRRSEPQSTPVLRGLAGLRASVVLFGDSLTQRGWEEGGWVARMAAHFGRRADVYNRGFGGYNTRWGRFLLPQLLPLPPTPTERHQLITIWFGANDAADETQGVHVPLDEYIDNLRVMVAHARRVAVRVVLLTPPPVHEPTRLAYQRRTYGDKATGKMERTTERAGEYAAAVVRLGTELSVPVVDVHGEMLARDEWPSFVGAGDEPPGDGLHLAPAGQRFVGALLLETLSQIGLAGAALDALPIELPLGQKMAAADFEGCMRRYQAAAAYVGNGVGLVP
jgi:lysophospholipase L1-like esterase